jgi:hypothetical protein
MNLTTNFDRGKVAPRPSQSRETEKYGHGSRGVRKQEWLCWRGQQQFTLPYLPNHRPPLRTWSYMSTHGSSESRKYTMFYFFSNFDTTENLTAKISAFPSCYTHKTVYMYGLCWHDMLTSENCKINRILLNKNTAARILLSFRAVFCLLCQEAYIYEPLWLPILSLSIYSLADMRVCDRY